VSYWLEDVSRVLAARMSRRQAMRVVGAGIGAIGLASVLPGKVGLAGGFVPLDLCPALSPPWAKFVPPGSGGECMPLNPDVTCFEEIASPDGDCGIRVCTTSASSSCCTCVAMAQAFPLGGAFSTASAHLTASWFSADRGVDDPFSLASLGIVLLMGTTPVTSGIFVAEMRPNNNCAGAYPPPQHLVDSDGPIDIPLSILAPSASFDGIVIGLQGYACGTGTNSIELAGAAIEVIP
jgi:hypothetical protein